MYKGVAMREVLEIEDMNCNNCLETIRKFVLDCNGVIGIDADLNSKTLVIDYNLPATPEIIREAIEDSGFNIKQVLREVE